MPRLTPALPIDHEAIAAGIASIRVELGVPAGFPPAVLAAAEAATPMDIGRNDRRDLPFVTIDPQGSTDLDQALYVEPGDGGHIVWYAIADVASFVRPGDPIDVESHLRGATLYAPDGRAPLHPAALSEGAASLLPGEDRPVVLWRLTLDGDGALIGTTVGRAWVRSREQLTYEQAQRRIDSGDALLAPLEVVGRQRLAQELDRGGVSLPLPEQEVERSHGRFTLSYRTTLPVEGWNAQLSLLCGLAAADLMLAADRGMLRTLPPASPDALATLQRQARALDVAWPDGATYGEVVRASDPSDPRHAAFLHQCTRLFRGADYRPLGVAVDEEGQPLIHAAIAAPYAHVTAPLRRLGDRYATEAVLAVVAGDEVPTWVTEALAEMPSILRGAAQRASELDRAAVDLVEALILADRVGESFPGVVVDHRRDGAVVQLRSPAIVGKIDTQPPLGAVVDVVVEAVDVAARRVSLGVTGQPMVAPVEPN